MWQEAGLTSSQSPADEVIVVLKIPNVLLSVLGWTRQWQESARQDFPGRNLKSIMNINTLICSASMLMTNPTSLVCEV